MNLSYSRRFYFRSRIHFQFRITVRWYTSRALYANFTKFDRKLSSDYGNWTGIRILFKIWQPIKGYVSDISRTFVGCMSKGRIYILPPRHQGEMFFHRLMIGVTKYSMIYKSKFKKIMQQPFNMRIPIWFRITRVTLSQGKNGVCVYC